MWLVLLSVAFTILAGFLTAVLFRRNQSVGVKKDVKPAAEAFLPCHEPEERNSSEESHPELNEPRAEGEAEGEAEDEAEGSVQTAGDLPNEARASNQEECERAGPEGDESSLSLSVNRMDDEDLRYMPGMLRTSQLEKMMSKEELEEEQRVQREQLAAIFKLLKENQETFGDVTEKDMEEQLKLYSI